MLEDSQGSGGEPRHNVVASPGKRGRHSNGKDRSGDGGGGGGGKAGKKVYTKPEDYDSDTELEDSGGVRRRKTEEEEAQESSSKETRRFKVRMAGVKVQNDEGSETFRFKVQMFKMVTHVDSNGRLPKLYFLALFIIKRWGQACLVVVVGAMYVFVRACFVFQLLSRRKEGARETCCDQLMAVSSSHHLKLLLLLLIFVAWVSHVGCILICRCVQSALMQSCDYRFNDPNSEGMKMEFPLTQDDMKLIWHFINKEV